MFLFSFSFPNLGVSDHLQRYGKLLGSFLLFLLFLLFSSGNRTTGSQCNSLVGQAHEKAHPSESCQVLTLTFWIPGQTLITAMSTASFIQNLSVLMQLVYSN